VGTRAKNNPPRRRGPAPERVIVPSSWKKTIEKATPTPRPLPKPSNKKARKK